MSCIDANLLKHRLKDAGILADRLRADGVEAWIDQYGQNPGEGWITWMRDQPTRAT